MLVATHFNTGTYHNHFVINSVNMWTGKKFNCNKKAYSKFRELSDKLCRQQQLTVIENPTSKTARPIYFAEKNGEPTKYNLMREAIDFALSICATQKDFYRVMKRQGYIVNLNPDLKYATIRSVNDKRNTRLYRLGEEYDREHIFQRLRTNTIWETNQKYNSFLKSTRTNCIVPKKVRFNGSLATTKKITGLKALYLRYYYMLGYLPKNKQHKPLSSEMREAWRKIDRYSKEIQLISSKDLNSLSDVNKFVSATKEQIVTLEKARQHIYNKLRRCDDPNEKAELLSKRDDYTTVLTALRKDVRVANYILDDNDEIKNNMKAEKIIQRERFEVRQRTRHRHDDLCR